VSNSIASRRKAHAVPTPEITLLLLLEEPELLQLLVLLVLLQLLLLEPLVQLQLPLLEQLHRKRQLHIHCLCRKKNHSRFHRLEQFRSKLVLVHSRLALACSTSPWLACTLLACNLCDRHQHCW